MVKTRYPKSIKKEALNAIATSLEDLSGTLENLFDVRQERMQAQLKLIQACRSDTEIRHYKEIGLLSDSNDCLLDSITRTH
jgi:hypothetical protein